MAILPCNKNECRMEKLKILQFMYKDSGWSFQKNGTSPRLGRKGLFAKHLKYLLKHSVLLIKLIETPDMTLRNEVCFLAKKHW